jgi:hypothetical protein
VNLEATPYIARHDPSGKFILHTGEPIGKIDSVWMNEDGLLLLQSGEVIAQIDDRDMAQCLGLLRAGETGRLAASDDDLLNWLSNSAEDEHFLHFRDGERLLPIQRISRADTSSRFGFHALPRP